MQVNKAPWWRNDVYSRRRPHLAIRSRVVRAIRDFFDSRDFVEVDTPALQISPGNEVHLHAFSTELKDPHGGEPLALYLHTSPEFAMKKLLVAGEKRIYQMAHVFRNGERSSRHHPEFTMLEWYRADAGIGDIMDDCIGLVRDAASVSGGRRIFRAGGMECDPFAEWEVLSVPDAFKRYAGIDLLATAPNPMAPDAGLLIREAAKAGVRTTDGDTWDDVFFRVMMGRIEPFLGNGSPTFLCDYPVSMAALARPKPENPQLAERFELYMAGYEIANAFGELTDPEEQLRRFRNDMDLKEKLHGERYPIDMDFIAALRQGMPPSSGIALGVDRLAMLCAGTENIDDVQWMPVALTN